MTTRHDREIPRRLTVAGGEGMTGEQVTAKTIRRFGWQGDRLRRLNAGDPDAEAYFVAFEDFTAERNRLQAEVEHLRLVLRTAEGNFAVVDEAAQRKGEQRDALLAEVETLRSSVSSWKVEEEDWKRREAELLAEVERLRGEVLAANREAGLQETGGRYQGTELDELLADPDGQHAAEELRLLRAVVTAANDTSGEWQYRTAEALEALRVFSVREKSR